MKRLLIIAIVLAFCDMVGGGKVIPLEKVAFAPLPANSLDFFYSNMRSEFIFCAYGKKTGNTVRVERLIAPYMGNTGEGSLQYFYDPNDCPQKDLLGMIHSHMQPLRACSFSEVDIVDFLNTKFRYDFVYCGVHGLIFHDPLQARAELEVFRSQAKKVASK